MKWELRDWSITISRSREPEFLSRLMPTLLCAHFLIAFPVPLLLARALACNWELHLSSFTRHGNGSKYPMWAPMDMPIDATCSPSSGQKFHLSNSLNDQVTNVLVYFSWGWYNLAGPSPTLWYFGRGESHVWSIIMAIYAIIEVSV